jgi:hypothetical protein
VKNCANAADRIAHRLETVVCCIEDHRRAEATGIDPHRQEAFCKSA